MTARQSHRLGQAIYGRRKARRLSQVDFAERAGVHWITLRKVEGGDTRNPSVDTVCAIAHVLGLKGSDLLAEAGL